MNTISNERLEKIAAGGGFNFSEVEAISSELLALRKERERAEPVGEVVLGSRDDEGNYPHAHVICLAGEGCADWDNFPDGFKLYTAPPAPVADDDSEIKWRELALQFDGHRMQAICFLKQILNELPVAEFSSAREFLKSGPLPGEEVLRNRIAALAPPAPVDVPNELVSELLDIAKRAAEEADECAYVEFSDKSMKHAREIGEWERRAVMIQPGDDDIGSWSNHKNTPTDKPKSEMSQQAEQLLRDTTALAATLSEETDTTSQQFESLAGKALVPEGWKLVPIEPTDAMCDIGHIGVDVLTGVTDDNEYYSIDGPYAAKVYRAMIAAAPEPCK